METRPNLYVTRGLPGSGKSTWAADMRKMVGGVRANRDDLRFSIYGSDGVLPYEAEEHISYVQRAIVRRALRDGLTVYVDDTNLRLKYVRVWEQMAAEENAGFVVVDFFDLPVETCIQRDADRGRAGGRTVGKDVILGMHKKFFQGGKGPAPYEYTSQETLTYKKYTGSPGMPQAVVVDLDGTCTIRVNGPDGKTMRGPFEWGRVGEDAPYHAVVNLVRLLQAHFSIVFLSGRDEVCSFETRDWLNRHGLKGELYMRPQNDNRRDSIVKDELFETYVAQFFDVQFILDDRNQVVEMWRAKGIPTFQVAEGNF